MALTNPITGQPLGVANGMYSPRLETLQMEYSSGMYTNPTDLQRLEREMAQAIKNISLDMNAVKVEDREKGSTASAQCKEGDYLCKYNGFLDSFKESVDSFFGKGKDIIGAVSDVAGPSSDCAICDKVSGYFKKIGTKLGVVVIGLLLILGAVIIYRK